MSEKKLNHHTVWLPDDLHNYLAQLELEEVRRTGEEIGMSTLIRRIIRFHMQISNSLDNQGMQGTKGENS